MYQRLSFVGKGSILEALEVLHQDHLQVDMDEHKWITYLTGYIAAALNLSKDPNKILQTLRQTCDSSARNRVSEDEFKKALWRDF